MADPKTGQFLSLTKSSVHSLLMLHGMDETEEIPDKILQSPIIVIDPDQS